MHNILASIRILAELRHGIMFGTFLPRCYMNMSPKIVDTKLPSINSQQGTFCLSTSSSNENLSADEECNALQ